MEDFIPTRVSKIKKDGVKRFVLINYEKPKKKIEIVSKSEENNDAQNPRFNMTKNECSKNDDTKKRKLDIKRVRYEVMKFGMSGFKGAEAEKAEIALAISLGAKPSKKKGINYKILQHKKTWQKDVTLASSFRSLLNDKHKKTQDQFNKNKGSDSLLKIYGKVNKKNIG